MRHEWYFSNGVRPDYRKESLKINPYLNHNWRMNNEWIMNWLVLEQVVRAFNWFVLWTLETFNRRNQLSLSHIMVLLNLLWSKRTPFHLNDVAVWCCLGIAVRIQYGAGNFCATCKLISNHGISFAFSPNDCCFMDNFRKLDGPFRIFHASVVVTCRVSQKISLRYIVGWLRFDPETTKMRTMNLQCLFQ